MLNRGTSRRGKLLLGGFQPRVCAVLFRDSKQNQIHQPARPYNVDFSEKAIFWNIEKKGRIFASGVRFFGISEVDVLP